MFYCAEVFLGSSYEFILNRKILFIIVRLLTGIFNPCRNSTYVSPPTMVIVRLLVYLMDISNMSISGQRLDESFIINY